MKRRCKDTSFDSVARDIVKKSISSAICVDNVFVEPYSEVTDNQDEETPRKLYESFRKQDCTLDVYRYVDMSKWEEDRDYVLRNRDLLILDWELVGDPPFKDALRILGEAVRLQSLPFVVIYTWQIDTSLVEFNILSYFGPPFKSVSDRKTEFDGFCEIVDDETDVDDAARLFEDIFEECREFVLRPSARAEIRENLIALIRERYGDGNLGDIMRGVVEAGKDAFGVQTFEDLVEVIAFHFGNAMVNERRESLDVTPVTGVKHAFIVGNTMIVIMVKPKASDPDGVATISPEEVYTKLARSVFQRPRNFLTLLALEMKSLYRDNVGVIGSELYDIHEVAFFHHQQNLESADDFYDFLRNCWKNQLSAFNMLQNPQLFSVLEEYKDKENYGDVIEKWKAENREGLVNELTKLNYQFSFLQVDRKKGDRLRFGDLLTLSRDSEGQETLGFVLCVTPHCDCLHPKNISHKFHFVLGTETSLDEGLANAEQGLYSFLVLEGCPVCICWNKKPFTLHIPDDKNNISKPIHVLYHREDHYLQHIACQKENYTLRIAYEAFSHASRMGIELARLNLEDDPEVEHGSTDSKRDSGDS